MIDFEDDEKTDPGIVVKKIAQPPASLSSKIKKIGATEPSEAPAPLPGKMPDLGILNALMRDPEINEIMINDVRNIMVEKAGQMFVSGLYYTSLDELNRAVRLILDAAGRVMTLESPYVDAMLPDGSRVNIVGPPLTLYGPCVTIRKFPAKKFSLDDLVEKDMLDKRMAYFLQACALGRINIIFSGGTGSGKTTLLNALVGLIPKSERLVIIEDTPEITFLHPNSVKLQSKLQIGISPGVSARELVANSLRMRPDRVILGECRRGEAFDMLQAMNTGHEGSMTTVHANSPRDALSRLETLCLLSGVELPLLAVRRQISEAVDLIVQTKRVRNVGRRVVAITEVVGMESDTITTQDIFSYSLETGTFSGNGLVPNFLSRMKDNGVELPPNFFA